MSENLAIAYYPQNLEINGAAHPEKIQGYEGPGWYFWDESWSHCHGPYESQEKAKGEFEIYCKTMLSPKEKPEPLEDYYDSE